jgi:hypothetical protein
MCVPSMVVCHKITVPCLLHTSCGMLFQIIWVCYVEVKPADVEGRGAKWLLWIMRCIIYFDTVCLSYFWWNESSCCYFS